jgi:hypothetical protein
MKGIMQGKVKWEQTLQPERTAAAKPAPKKPRLLKAITMRTLRNKKIT